MIDPTQLVHENVSSLFEKLARLFTHHSTLRSIIKSPTLQEFKRGAYSPGFRVSTVYPSLGYEYLNVFLLAAISVSVSMPSSSLLKTFPLFLPRPPMPVPAHRLHGPWHQARRTMQHLGSVLLMTFQFVLNLVIKHCINLQSSVWEP